VALCVSVELFAKTFVYDYSQMDATFIVKTYQ